MGTDRFCVDVDALWERTRMDANTGKNNGKRKNLTIKHTRMPPMCKNPHENARYVQETQENARENKARPPSIRDL